MVWDYSIYDVLELSFCSSSSSPKKWRLKFSMVNSSSRTSIVVRIFLQWSMTCKVSSERDFSSHSSGVVVHTIIYLRTFLPRFTTTSRQPHPFLATCFFLSNTTLTAESNIDFAFVQQNSAKVESSFKKGNFLLSAFQKLCFGITIKKIGITLVSLFCIVEYRYVLFCPLWQNIPLRSETFAFSKLDHITLLFRIAPY